MRPWGKAGAVIGPGAVIGHRTFHGRKGRLSAHKRSVLEELGPRFLRNQPVDLANWFAHEGPLVVEIGFGMGHATAELATARPHERVLACEVHTAGVANLCLLLEAAGIGNVVVVDDDGLDVLTSLPDRSVRELRAFFPDPWPKQGQRHRRLIQPQVVSAMVTKLETGGRLSLATDDAGYADQMVEVCAAEIGLIGGVVTRPEWRPVTKYERRGIAAGRTISDLVYECVRL